MTPEVRLVKNGMTPDDIAVQDRRCGRNTLEHSDYVEILVDSGPSGVGGYILKIKEERYTAPAPLHELEYM